MDKIKEEIEKDKQEIEERQAVFKRDYYKYRKIAEQYLVQESYSDLVPFFEQEAAIKISQLDNTMAVLRIAVSIYQMEQEENVPIKILDGLHTLEEVEQVYLTSKFILWRLLFRDEKKEFIDYVADKQLSIPHIKYLIHTSAFEKADTAFQIAMLFKEGGYFGKAFAMLNYFNELGGDPELVYCEMADVCFQARQYKAAADCISKIQNPSGLLNQYEQKWGITYGS